MFVRYATYAHVITKSDATLDKFTDKASVADWASDAMKWATGTGLINGTGTGTTLSPTMTATREQFAAIIHRFNTLKFDYELAYEAPEYGTYTDLYKTIRIRSRSVLQSTWQTRNPRKSYRLQSGICFERSR